MEIPELTKEEISKLYIEPAVNGLCEKLVAGEALTELDRKVLESCGYDPDALVALHNFVAGRTGRG